MGSRGKSERKDRRRERRFARHKITHLNSWVFSLTESQVDSYVSMLSKRVQAFKDFEKTERYQELYKRAYGIGKPPGNSDKAAYNELSHYHEKAAGAVYILETIEDKKAGLYNNKN